MERKESDESGRKIIDEAMKWFVTENVVREDAAVTRRSDWKTDPNRGQTEGEEGEGGWKQNSWPASNESAPLRLHSKKKCLCTLWMVLLRGAFDDGDGDNFE